MYILITARYRYFISVKDIKMSHFPAAKSTKKSRSSMNEIHLVSHIRSASLDPYRARGVCWTLLLHGKRCHISTLYSSRTHMELYTKWTQSKPTYKHAQTDHCPFSDSVMYLRFSVNIAWPDWKDWSMGDTTIEMDPHKKTSCSIKQLRVHYRALVFPLCCLWSS